MTLRDLFDYQRFAANPGLQAKIDAAEEKYILNGVEIPDEELDVSAAGDAVFPARKTHGNGNG